MEAALACRGLSKSYGGARALTDVTFVVEPGEIHVLLGENGAGKSTLVKIAAGVVASDTGTVDVGGVSLPPGNVQAAQAAGVNIIHQEPRLFGDLDVVGNIYLDRPPRRWGTIDWAAAIRETQKLLDRVGCRVSPRAKVRDLSVADQQMVDIAAALRRDPKVLIVDEPTASLTPAEVARLFSNLRGLRDRGVAIVFIGHRLEEIMEIADRITVLRDGELVTVVRAAETDADALVRAMAGRAVEEAAAPAARPTGDVLLRVRDLASAGAFREVSFDVRAGEVVGLAGLVGAGRTEIAEAIFGVRSREGGTVEVGTSRSRPRNAAQAVRAGLVYVPEDRARHGLAVRCSIRENATVGLLSSLARHGVRRGRRERETAAGAIRQYAVRAASTEQPVSSLSGGNQQKIAVAKWLLTGPQVVIVDEPTRGVDVGAKAAIHRIVLDLADRGIAIVVISSETKELRLLADRILVVREGRLAGELGRADATDERIVALATRNVDVAGAST
ncbi:ribose transport system ATP-binding protein [Actinoplanes sp. SE50]|uniref:sugar ABC transporter ATP-binding protein n=1 Tax=Actinoplanes sp. SE50 TaxID=2033844 RepID=UPI00023EBBB9|nr:sugar ABC transporter ATP-binding protein [Actinoplanes sp. SE50]AEV85062.1 ribose transport system ATP-binding protein [Actinoplanes sp. SE50/110]ATO83453.1 ribose transport system ATP-binding protein [Actinoplanes sp. SE50]SLM00860.1 ribose transport system ATP-binding protein [Actinoplanes sp. SE50/110]